MAVAARARTVACMPMKPPQCLSSEPQDPCPASTEVTALPAVRTRPRAGLWRLVREPVGPYDSRVEVLLAREHGLVPLQLRFTTPPAGEPLELRLSEGLPPAEADLPPP